MNKHRSNWRGGWTSEKQKEYGRRRITTTSKDGKVYTITGTKRIRPINEKCEICNTKPFRLAYHHWNDIKIIQGIWCCSRCHHILNSLEYINLMLKCIWLRIRRSF